MVNSIEGIVWEAEAETLAFSFVSRQADKLLGYPSEQWLTEPTFWKDHLHPEDLDRAVHFWLDAKTEKRKHDCEYRMIAADGRVVWIRDLVTVVLQDGLPTHLRGVMADVSERKRAEEERDRLRQLEAELAHTNRVTTMGELTASLAHEVNQPIFAAMTNANICVRWLSGGAPNIEEAREAANRIIKDANRAAEIISRIRLLFKKGAPQRELVNINEVISDITVLLRNEAARSGVLLRSELAKDVPAVMGDRVQLQQVFMNLIMNGIDAMRDLGGVRELMVRSAQDGNDHLILSVSDTGTGLPQQADRIFEAFFTTKSQGTGMGLAISRSIIESHGGHLWASPNSSRGTIFQFTLPIEGSQ